ncbi:hypothetical protein GCM10017714_20950 [Curtobacterium pusillum]|uniref:Lipoprotein n=1 Tax=Curtobacterium pusillum TaxID=69373 RepID=A0AAW3T4F3_9MICO|nr:hypothetical protein [Curtobacterium pusillum]MBA8989810.1 hypothetical protein [Curtobacterium pusillum]NUU14612.1 hypothetical protein [Curtobacterium pusillum]GLK31954.1 hypothetical protein GCM10017610_22390 [Curtobacterium pusillum]
MSVLVGALLTACSAEPEGQGLAHESFASAGPWAEEFAASSEHASEFETAILRDGVITPAELEEAQSRKRRCMLDAGIIWDIFDDGTSQAEAADGGALGPTDEVHAVLDRCARRFDRSVTYLFNEIRRNPERQDEAKITVTCLRNAGVVGPEYDELRWRADDEEGTYPFDVYDARVEECRLDPLGLWRSP